MIEYIKGQLTELNPTVAVIEAAGVGYEVNIALPTYSALVSKEGQEAKLYTTEIIREDTHDLFGFQTKGERALFVLLMTVSGIGANTARMIMSAFFRQRRYADYCHGQCKSVVASERPWSEDGTACYCRSERQGVEDRYRGRPDGVADGG